jgi:serine/threonine protein kinase/Tol biopolymer transport system component
MTDLAIGSQLGPYRIDGVLGAGGMGKVFKARDTRLGRDVAIKVSAERFNDRFEREARAIAALNHPHICQLFDIGPDYLVMELVEGEPLVSQTKPGPLPVDRAVEYAMQILDALDVAHRKGIIHRDLKPGNILLTKRGIKLLDFGLAKQTGGAAEPDDPTLTALTGQGQILGTPQYISPEQLQGKEADARSDLFSFGCVLYEMLSGKRAFTGQSTMSVMAAILEREPIPLDVPPALERVIKTCLAKNPDERFQNALDVKHNLVWALETPAAARVAAPVNARQNRWWIIAAAALALGALGGWATSLFRQTPVEDEALRLEIDPPPGSQIAWGTNAAGISLSPNGKMAAYVAKGNLKNSIWVRALDGTATRMIEGTDGADYPFWSPDSRSIAYFAGGKLLRVEMAGGAPRAICDVPETGNSRGGAWGGNDQIVFAVWSSSIFQVAASGGQPSALTKLDVSRGEAFHYWPQILPGGRFLYFARSKKPENSGVFVASVARPGDRVKLLSIDGNALYAPGPRGNEGYLLWSRDGALVAQDFNASTLKLSGEPRTVADHVATMSVSGQLIAAASTTGLLLFTASPPQQQFTWRDRTGKTSGLVGQPGLDNMFRLSPDGRRIAFGHLSQAGKGDLWMLEVNRGVTSPLSSRTGTNIWPVWSPDSRSVVFTSGPPFNLFRAEVGGSDERRLTQSEAFQFPDDWSHDGRFILFDQNGPGTKTDLWILPITPDGVPGNPQPKPWLQTPSNEYLGVFSPDDRWVAYESDESGRFEIYIDTFPERHGKVRISANGGMVARWGAGGRELFYVSPESKLMAVSLKAGSAAEPSTPRELFTLDVFDPDVSPYEVAPDGQSFLTIGTPAHASEPLTLIVNWPALLKKPGAK